ncbi:hypothetical protein T484DRAFT_1983374 [Baffinella frigidus]|nr:hypothetical protein T484DRAFT_1983374 [Cryptophyta sp. CCMP2293]
MGRTAAGLVVVGVVAMVCLVLPAARPVALMFEDEPRGSERGLGRVEQRNRMQSDGGLQFVNPRAVQGVFEVKPLNGPARESASRGRAGRGRAGAGWQSASQPRLSKRSRKASPPPQGNPPSAGKKVLSAMAQIEQMYSGLHGASDKAAATPLVNEGAAAQALAKSLRGEMPLKNLEGQMHKAIHIADAKIHQAMESSAAAEDELARYRKEVAGGEKLGVKDMEYLRATRNYAAYARKEVLDAEQLDDNGRKVLASAAGVLGSAHDAEVKARVTDDAAGLAAAQSLVSREIETVQKAKQAHAAAQHDRADSLENAFVSQVVDRVRHARYAKHAPNYASVAQLGQDSHKQLAQAQRTLRAAQATKVLAEKWLKRADYQDAVRSTVRHTQKDAAQSLAYLRAEEQAGAGAAHAGRARRVAMRHAAEEALAARKAELAAAASASGH